MRGPQNDFVLIWRSAQVVVDGFLFEFVLDFVPDGVAGFGGGKEALGVFGDGFEIADEGGAVGVISEEGLEPGVGADVSVSVGEELGQILFKVGRGHSVEVGKVGVAGHTAASLKPGDWVVGGSG